MSFTGLYDIRPPVKDDISFIMATWLKGLYYGESWFSQIPKDIFMNSYKKIASTILINPNINVRVACLKEDPGVILGYSITTSDDKAVVWVFVKKPWRENGIAKSLLPTSPQYVTHLTALGKTLLPKLKTAVFNPFY